MADVVDGALRLTPEEELLVLRAFVASCPQCEGFGKIASCYRPMKRGRAHGTKFRARFGRVREKWCTRCGVAGRLADELEQRIEDCGDGGG